MSESPPILVCMLIDERPPGAPGSLPGTCSICGQHVWVSIAGRRTLQEHPDCKIACMPCGMAHAATDEDPHFTVAKGAWDEVEAIMGPEAVAEGKRRIGDLNRAMRRAQARKQQRSG